MSFIGRKKTPTLIIIAEKKSYDLGMLEELLHGIATALKLPTIIITQFKLPPSLTRRYPHVVTEKKLTPEILKRADIGLMLEGNICQKNLELLVETKVVPILPASLQTHFFQNYDAVHQIGNCFTFEHTNNPWTIFCALVRASETYQFPYDWSSVLRSLKIMK